MRAGVTDLLLSFGLQTFLKKKCK